MPLHVAAVMWAEGLHCFQNNKNENLLFLKKSTWLIFEKTLQKLQGNLTTVIEKYSEILVKFCRNHTITRNTPFSPPHWTYTLRSLLSSSPKPWSSHLLLLPFWRSLNHCLPSYLLSINQISSKLTRNVPIPSWTLGCTLKLQSPNKWHTFLVISNCTADSPVCS